jgi:hypothetical protein
MIPMVTFPTKITSFVTTETQELVEVGNHDNRGSRSMHRDTDKHNLH